MTRYILAALFVGGGATFVVDGALHADPTSVGGGAVLIALGVLLAKFGRGRL